MDRSGWWYLVIIVPLIGFLVLLFWFVSRGTAGPNRFGPDPLGGDPGGFSGSYTSGPIR